MAPTAAHRFADGGTDETGGVGENAGSTGDDRCRDHRPPVGGTGPRSPTTSEPIRSAGPRHRSPVDLRRPTEGHHEERQPRRDRGDQPEHLPRGGGRRPALGHGYPLAHDRGENWTTVLGLAAGGTHRNPPGGRPVRQSGQLHQRPAPSDAPDTWGSIQPIGCGLLLNNCGAPGAGVPAYANYVDAPSGGTSPLRESDPLEQCHPPPVDQPESRRGASVQP